MPNTIVDNSSIIFDNMLIIGPDISENKVFDNLKLIQSRREISIAILSTGEAMETLRGQIEPQTRIDIYAHGNFGIKDSDFWLTLGSVPFFPERKRYATD